MKKNTENVFLQKAEDGIEEDRKNFNQNNQKYNKSYIDLNKQEKYENLESTFDHLKVIYSDHGNARRALTGALSENDFPGAKNRKSYYISDFACRGGFYDESDSNINLINVLKNKINNTDTIGFFSHAKVDYNVACKQSIDRNGNRGTRRLPNNKNGVFVTGDKYNKEDYFDYFCILNEKENNETLQRIYKIPQQLCYWREALIDSGEFMTAFKALQNGETYQFETDALVSDDSGKLVSERTTITIQGTVQEVEVRYDKETRSAKICNKVEIGVEQSSKKKQFSI